MNDIYLSGTLGIDSIGFERLFVNSPNEDEE